MGSLTRSVSTDTAGQVYSGRFAIAGTTVLTATVVETDVEWSALDATTTAYAGVVARYTDASNWLVAFVRIESGDYQRVEVHKRVAGTVTQLGAEAGSPVRGSAAWHTLRLQVDADGGWSVWCFPRDGSPGSPVLTGSDSALATGGALASGKVGIYDRGATGD